MIDHRFESIGHGAWCIARLVDRSIVGDSGSGTGKLIYPGQDTGQRIINGHGWLLEHSKRWTRLGVVLWGRPTLNHAGCHYDVDSSVKKLLAPFRTRDISISVDRRRVSGQVISILGSVVGHVITDWVMRERELNRTMTRRSWKGDSIDSLSLSFSLSKQNVIDLWIHGCLAIYG